jgi:adenylate kinase
MRAVVTGQVGLDKGPYLDAVAALAAEQGEEVRVHHVGRLMYAEAPDVRPARILDLPLSRLHALRRAVLRDVLAGSAAGGHEIINTHATFRWRHGLFPAFDFDQLAALAPGLFVCLVDNIETVHHRLHAEHQIDATLKDCMVWREEEILATQLMSKAVPGSRFYVLSRGRHAPTTLQMYRLLCRPGMRRVYPSFPMTHVAGNEPIEAEINGFRARLSQRFITFDPGDVDEKMLLERAIEAARRGEEFIEIAPGGGPALDPPRVAVRQVLDIAGDIDGQIYMRDFALIDQSDMIVSYIPELPGGVPGLSSGVERELHHAFEHTRDVFVVWRPARPPSPFITETATRIFATVDEAMEHFEREGMFAGGTLFGH